MKTLIVEDDECHQEYLRTAAANAGLSRQDQCCTTCLTDAKKMFNDHRPEIVLLDLFFYEDPNHKKSGFFYRDFMEHVVSLGRPWPEIIAVTGHEQSIKHQESLFDWIEMGLLVDVIHKDLANVDWKLFQMVLTLKLKRVLYQRNLESFAQDGCETEMAKRGIYGRDPAMLKLWSDILNAASTDMVVLIEGETGTGKELVANALQHFSRRSKMPYQRVNCGAIAPTLATETLFGHEKGAFTGAVSRKAGLFETLDGGTLFLDEISETDREFQNNLLRVIECGELQRLGGTETIKVDVRVIAATNRNLGQLVQENRFRQDLYFRLRQYVLLVPRLRDRGEDTRHLLLKFLKEFNNKHNKDIAFSQDCIDAVAAYDWPGNVRELRSFVQWAVVSQTSPVSVDALREHISMQCTEEMTVRKPMPGSPECVVSPPVSNSELEAFLGLILTPEGINRVRGLFERMKPGAGVQRGIMQALAFLGRDGREKGIARAEFLEFVGLEKTSGSKYLSALDASGLTERAESLQGCGVRHRINRESEAILWKQQKQ